MSGHLPVLLCFISRILIFKQQGQKTNREEEDETIQGSILGGRSKKLDSDFSQIQIKGVDNNFLFMANLENDPLLLTFLD